MHIPFSATSDFSGPDNMIRDYDISKDIGVSYQELSGRGPKSGQYLNKEVHEIYFIIEGSGKFFVDDEMYEVQEKDIVVAEPGSPHHIEADSIRYITITRPDWYPEQAETVA